jgi:5'-nucleotidase
MTAAPAADQAGTGVPDGPGVVVTNDDGIDSPGLHELAGAAASLGHDVLVAAPAYEASGSSASMAAAGPGPRITLDRRDLPGLDGIPGYAVRAAPAFIAFAAAQRAFGGRPQLLLSGINRGPNTGRAVLHSGTVGAALTAANHGILAAAFSLDCEGASVCHWATAAAVAREVIPVLARLRPGLALNVNVPNVPPGRLRGIRYGRLAEVGAVQVSIAGSGGTQLELTVSQPRHVNAPDSDSAALTAGFASVTAVRAICEAPAGTVPWLPPPEHPGPAGHRSGLSGTAGARGD